MQSDLWYSFLMSNDIRQKQHTMIGCRHVQYYVILHIPLLQFSVVKPSHFPTITSSISLVTSIPMYILCITTDSHCSIHMLLLIVSYQCIKIFMDCMILSCVSWQIFQQVCLSWLLLLKFVGRLNTKFLHPYPLKWALKLYNMTPLKCDRACENREYGHKLHPVSLISHILVLE